MPNGVQNSGELMNKFSKVTGLIAFWTELSLLIAIILLIFFQKSIVGIYLSSLDEYKDIFIVPWQEIIKNFNCIDWIFVYKCIFAKL